MSPYRTPRREVESTSLSRRSFVRDAARAAGPLADSGGAIWGA